MNHKCIILYKQFSETYSQQKKAIKNDMNLSQSKTARFKILISS